MSVTRTLTAVLIALVSSVTVLFTSCGKIDPDEDHGAHLHYLGFSSFNSCTLNYAREPEVRVCVTGTSGATLEKAKDYSKRAVLTWFRALRQIDDKITSNVVFSCNSPHLKVNMIPGTGTSSAGCGRSNIYTEKTYGTYLHEFGHAIAALSDTYTGRSAGACRSGQPKSVMCWGAYGPNKDPQGFSLLYQDDVNGIQAQYKKAMASRGVQLVPPAVQIDPLAPIDPNNPWPTGGSSPTPDNGQNPGGGSNNSGGNVYGSDIFMSAGAKLSTLQAGPTLHISTRINLDQVIVCNGNVTDLDACIAGSARYPVEFMMRLGDRKVYRTVIQSAISSSFQLTVFAGGTINGKFQASDRKSFVLNRD